MLSTHKSQNPENINTNEYTREKKNPRNPFSFSSENAPYKQTQKESKEKWG